MMLKDSLIIDDHKILLIICGINDKNLRKLEKISNCKIYTDNNEIFIEGENKNTVEKVINVLISIASKDGEIYGNMIEILYNEIQMHTDIDLSEILSEKIEIDKAKKVFVPRTVNQALYLKLLKEKDIVFASGPAGTGKTFLAIAFAINELLQKNVKKVILTRPVVEAGENLGFLPGDYIQKINPYLVPLFDAINMILNNELVLKLNEHNLIEIAPLAYMRGRTFTNAIVILDEAQNTTINQMKLFLTRPDEKSKLIITGDVTQIDLPKKQKSGMVYSLKVLKNINEIGFIEFNDHDVIRHPLIKKIIKAFSSYREDQ
jgi:phosphate starvation-inducible PhoH-like protein